ncbi:hypothetical protein [Novosphingobium humi]|uniref:Uncharacterized protein n=1 Tax=Novosphingobium humi TaxID=2282397 RepID=A0ABY7U2N8_9SPHN|nr:hypothetical protein [Novosphingobium humi]WCT78614.1 hypothetical protein PQ457_06540 [Novosphingobium humi]
MKSSDRRAALATYEERKVQAPLPREICAIPIIQKAGFRRRLRCHRNDNYYEKTVR